MNTLADTLPTDISRNIYRMAIKAKDEENKRQIHATIWCALHFILTGTVLHIEESLHNGVQCRQTSAVQRSYHDTDGILHRRR